MPDVLEARARTLARAVERIRPQVVLIEHYPFSKWELELEMAAPIEAARRSSAGVRVVCSLRDIVRKTRYEAAAPDAYEALVLSRLRESFDAILVHADPAFTRLEEHFGRAGELALPVHYTGFVVEPLGPAAGLAPPHRHAVLSCGGGTRSQAFLLGSIEAFRRLSDAGALGSMRLLVFPSPYSGAVETDALKAATRSGPFELHEFSPDFSSWLAGSALSISRAGYNTCGQLLRTAARSVLVPDPEMSDQGLRATRLAELGRATVVDGRAPRPEEIAAAIETALAQPPAHLDLDVDGVAATRAILERLAGGATQGASCRSHAR